MNVKMKRIKNATYYCVIFCIAIIVLKQGFSQSPKHNSNTARPTNEPLLSDVAYNRLKEINTIVFAHNTFLDKQLQDETGNNLLENLRIDDSALALLKEGLDIIASVKTPIFLSNPYISSPSYRLYFDEKRFGSKIYLTTDDFFSNASTDGLCMILIGSVLKKSIKIYLSLGNYEAACDIIEQYISMINLIQVYDCWSATQKSGFIYDMIQITICQFDGVPESVQRRLNCFCDSLLSGFHKVISERELSLKKDILFFLPIIKELPDRTLYDKAICVLNSSITMTFSSKDSLKLEIDTYTNIVLENKKRIKAILEEYDRNNNHSKWFVLEKLLLEEEYLRFLNLKLRFATKIK